MPTLIRSASLTNFADVARQHGLDPAALLRAVGLPSRSLVDPDLKVPFRSVHRLLELASVQSGEEAFGLLVGESRRISNLGPLGLLLRDEPTLKHALEAIVRHMRVHNEALVVRLEYDTGLAVIRVELAVDTADSLQQAEELALAVSFQLIKLFMGPGWRPRLVCFSHGAPKDLAPYHRVFGRHVEFDHAFNGIVCNIADLDQPNPSADPVMARYAKELVKQEDVATDDFTAQVRQLILLLLPLGQCNAETLAQHLGCERRTISRRLAAEGTSFHAMVDAHRRQIAQRLLRAKDKRLDEVSSLLGFSAASAFCRWHKLTFGVPARAQAKR